MIEELFNKEFKEDFEKAIKPLLEKYHLQHLTLSVLDKENRMNGISFSGDELTKTQFMAIDLYLLNIHIELIEARLNETINTSKKN